MATTDDTYSPRLEQFARRQKQASENAKGLKDAFVDDMVGSIEAATTSASDPEDVETAEFDLIAGAREILRAPRVAEREAAEQRAKSRQERAQQLQGDRDQAKPSGAAASLVDLSPKKFKTALTSLFKELDVDQAHWLKEIAESAEKAAWEREHANDPAPVELIKGRADFDSDLAYDNYIEWKFPRGDDASDDDGDD